MELTQVVYLAGFMDGEGCIGLYKVKSSSGHKRGYVVQPRLCIANTNLAALKIIQEWCGGRIFSRAKAWKNFPNWKIGYILQFGIKEMPEIIRAIMPYLIIKKVQAGIVLEFLDHIKDIKYTPGIPHSDGEWEWRLDMVERMSKLNQKCPAVTVEVRK